MSHRRRHQTDIDPRAAAEEARRQAECEWCDEDDWEKLNTVKKMARPSCPKHQSAPPSPIILCDSCVEDHNPKEERRQELRERDRDVVLFECGIAQHANDPGKPRIEIEEQTGWDDEADEPITETKSIVDTSAPKPVPKIPVKCRCGAEIDEVFYNDRE